jgi:hypothetical protein
MEDCSFVHGKGGKLIRMTHNLCSFVHGKGGKLIRMTHNLNISDWITTSNSLTRYESS